MSAHLKSQNQKNNGFLGWIEEVGNKMPDVVTIFLSLSLLIIVLSFLGEMLGWSAVHPGSGETIKVFNLASSEGLRKIVSEFNNNISSFGPLYFGIVIMLGIGLLEGSGLASAMLRKFVIHLPAKYITFVVLLLGVNASIASDAGYIILPPIAALMFYAVGRNPIAGMLCGYAASACGHGAAFVITIVDVVTLGFSENAAQILNPGFKLTLLDNYYFILVSSIILPIAAYFTTEKIVIPRMGDYAPAANHEIPFNTSYELSEGEEIGLKHAGISALLYILIVALLILPPSAPLRNPETGSIIESPFMDGILLLVTLLFAIPSIFFGIRSGSIKSDKDVVKLITEGMSNFAGYIVVATFATQMINYFGWSNLGAIIAIKGATFLENLGLSPLILLIALIIFVSFINLFIGSCAAKYAILAPIFVPMFMLLNIHPAAVNLAYRIGDSVTNSITPMMAYFVLLLGYVQQWDKEAGLGTLMANLLPYSVTFLIAWVAQLILWYILNLPIGPGIYFNF